MNSFAAIVADNDGSAFVTKSEFEALKADFAKQGNNYNDSIAGKIDGAISSYLAGIRTNERITQESLINKCGYQWTNAWNPGTSALGDKLSYAIGISYVYNRQTGVDGAAAQYKIGSGSHDAPKIQTTGTTNSTYILYGASNYNSSYKALKGYMTSYMVSSAMMYYHIGGTGTTSTSIGGLSSTTFSSSNTYWEIKEISSNITLYGVTKAVSGIASFNNNDTITTPADIKRVSGNSIPTAKLYCVKEDELNKRGAAKTAGAATSAYGARWNGSSNVTSTVTPANYKVQGYLHSYTDVSNGYAGFIVADLSTIANEAVYYYSGLPLFEASDNGVVTLKLTFSNTASANTTWQIKEGKFTTNGAITAGLSGLQYGETEYTRSGTTTKNTYVVPSGVTQTIKFKVEAGKSYWIKANPASGYSTVKSTGISIETNVG